MRCCSVPTIVAVLATFSMIGGCGESKPAAVPTTTSTVVMPATALAPASPGMANSTIYLSERLRKACGIATIESVREAPKFDFDKSAILPEDGEVLAEVAQCLTTGPLKGRSVRLVGRAIHAGLRNTTWPSGTSLERGHEVSRSAGRRPAADDGDLAWRAGRDGQRRGNVAPGSPRRHRHSRPHSVDAPAPPRSWWPAPQHAVHSPILRTGAREGAFSVLPHPLHGCHGGARRP